MTDHEEDFGKIERLSNQPNEGRWQPIAGQTTEDFLQGAPELSRIPLKMSASSILSRGISPQDKSGSTTGLVVGYVQSGKTLSFETVIAMARDNEFALSIVVAGTSNPLFDQSTGRLKKDLKLDDPKHGRSWALFENLSPNNQEDLRRITSILREWADPDFPKNRRRTILITVLKNHSRLLNLTRALTQLSLDRMPALIFDDEADQASLNAEVNDDDESTTYSRLVELRNSLPLHSYLQYTATPQAPLLINIADTLSPTFVEVLEPGPGYCGGVSFFLQNQWSTKIIPPEDVPTANNVLTEPPESLLEAIRLFVVGVAIGVLLDDESNRSMVVHPSHRTTHHQEYVDWVRNIITEWTKILELPDGDPDKESLSEDMQVAFQELRSTIESPIPIFADVWQELRYSLGRIQVEEVNARQGRTPEIRWQTEYAWILVGGQALDRGFTVEGLTVTYMPRGLGVGNADTVQQRARFFGYKQSYLGFCRIYLEQATSNAFTAYVEHEEDIRRQLIQLQSENQPLTSWKRQFILDRSLRPCRQSVLEFDFIRGRFSNDWVQQRFVMQPDEFLNRNRHLISRFEDSLSFQPNDGHKNRTQIQKHGLASDISLSNVLSGLLLDFVNASRQDSMNYTGMLLQIEHALSENPDELCDVYQISNGMSRQRAINDKGVISELFQGSNSIDGVQIYPGDREIRSQNNVTIQLHTLDLKRDNQIIAEAVRVLTVWVPSRLAKPWLVQDEGNTGD